jgi:hypothetical protein
MFYVSAPVTERKNIRSGRKFEQKISFLYFPVYPSYGQVWAIKMFIGSITGRSDYWTMAFLTTKSLA